MVVSATEACSWYMNECHPAIVALSEEAGKLVMLLCVLTCLDQCVFFFQVNLLNGL